MHRLIMFLSQATVEMIWGVGFWFGERRWEVSTSERADGPVLSVTCSRGDWDLDPSETGVRRRVKRALCSGLTPPSSILSGSWASHPHAIKWPGPARPLPYLKALREQIRITDFLRIPS